MAVAASIEAVTDSGIKLESLDRDRVGIVMGTAYGSSSHVDEFFMSLLREGPRGAQPFLFPETVPNAPASHIAMVHRITGPNTTFCQNEVSAENALAYARDLLALDVADAVLVGGADELSWVQFACYDAVKALQKIRASGSDPVIPRPGYGLVLGEGAAVLVLERPEKAAARGARCYGSLDAVALSGGSARVGHYESGAVYGRVIEGALVDAGLSPADVDQVHVSANFSKELDPMECEHLVGHFGSRLEALGVMPLKYLIGDFGGAGALRAAAALMSLREGKPLPTLSPRILRGEGDGDVDWMVTESGRRCTNALMCSATFGGGCAALVFRAY
jgi:3-oxoacyl-[acyl-carrier-protein] synthase II